MSERLPVPPELEHLIEKREKESDRRQSNSRRKPDQRPEDLGPLGATESAGDSNTVPKTERRSGRDRRRSQNRRGNQKRRKDDA